ncbi:MAG: tRNA uridine-5-carboxymethylaminomethyl(34) synthesis GTPase MnmE, partial [Bacteroidota bacterium]
MNQWDDTIVALSTPAGVGALGVVRLSGPEAIAIAGKLFSKPLGELPGRSLVYGHLMKGEQILDDVLLSLFRGPRSYTKEDTVEISCHGSSYILQEVIQLLQQAGARLALPGEFTQRAYLNGSMDLAQAEAVADLIASTSAGAHQLAMNQMRGGVSDELKKLRTQLLDFTSLIELELDFGEEDVEFADRTQLSALISEMQQKLGSLIDSFTLGNAIKREVKSSNCVRS